MSTGQCCARPSVKPPKQNRQSQRAGDLPLRQDGEPHGMWMSQNAFTMTERWSQRSISQQGPDSNQEPLTILVAPPLSWVSGESVWEKATPTGNQHASQYAHFTWIFSLTPCITPISMKKQDQRIGGPAHIPQWMTCRAVIRCHQRRSVPSPDHTDVLASSPSSPREEDSPTLLPHALCYVGNTDCDSVRSFLFMIYLCFLEGTNWVA